jgi:anti-anti-sigma factor
MGTDDDTAPPARPAASVEVGLRPPAWPSFAAIVTLRGEHDLATSQDVRRTLGPIYGNVLVDLSDCGFIDSTVIGALLTKYQELEREGHRLELIVSSENPTIARTLSIVGLDTLVVVHQSPPSGQEGQG